jgi:hypothetical protein
MAVGAVVASIVSQYTDKGSKAARKDIAKLGKDFDAAAKKITKSFAVAAAASAAFAIKLGKDAVQAAAADEKQQTALATALRNTTNATEQAIAANVKYLDGLELQVAIDNEVLIPALQQLAQATGDLSQAQLLLRLSTDVSVASGKDLGTVSTAITKALNGQFGALTKLGLPLDQNAIKSKDLGKILVQLSQISRGQAAAAADTFAGKLESLRLRFNQISDTLGYALMPSILLFAEYLETKIAPALEYFLYLNEDKLTAALESSVKNIKEIANAFGNIYKVISGINDLLPIGIGGWIQLAVAIKAVSVAGGVLTTVLGILTIKSKMNKDMIAGLTLQNKKFRDILLSDASSGEKLLRVYYRMKGALLSSTPSVFIISQFHALKTAMLASAAAGNKLAAALILVGNKLKAVAVWLLRTPWGRIALGIGLVVTAISKLTGSDKITLSDQARAAEYSMWKAAKATESMDDAVNKYRSTQDKVVKKTKEQIAEEKRLAAIKAKADKDAKLRAKFEADYAKLNDTLAKRAGVKLLSSEDEKMVQINAAIALADRQKVINALDKERLKAMKEEILSLAVRNDLAKRYQDILQALADQKIDTKEITILAKMWGVPVEAVEAYLATLFAVEDATITDDEIINLAMKWGSTQAQAAQYLDFYQYLNDGILSDAEIEKLKTKWKLTEEQVRMYADFVGVVNDGKLTDAEIIKIQDKWKLTTDQVVEYIKKIGSPVSYSGTLIDPAKAAEIGWLNATAALQRYLDLLKAGSGVVVTNPAVPPTVVPPVVIPPKVDGSGLGGSKTDSAASSAANAIAYAVAKATGDTAKAAIAAAGVTPSALASQESGAIGAASIAAQLAAAEQQVKIASSLAAFKAKEAQDLAASQAASAQMDYDEKFRFNRGTVATASSMNSGNLMAGGSPVINVTVQGSVTSEQDLVQSIRTGLLRGQYNGDPITLQAI